MRLQAAEADAARLERETLNLKMEVAHLRERLRARVGGSTTAAELEAEGATLRAQVAEAERLAAARELERRALQAAHDQATRSLVRLDEAWRASAEDARRLRGEAERLQAEAAELRRALAESEEDARRLREASEALEQRASDTEAALEEASREVAELQQQGARMQIEGDRLRRRAAEAEREVEAARSAADEARRTNERLRVESEAAKRAMREAEVELLKLQEQHAPMVERLAAAEKLVRQHARDTEAAQDETRTVLREKEALKADKEESERRIENLKRAVEESEFETERVRRSVEAKESASEAHMREVARLKAALEERESSLLTKQHTIEQLQRDVEDLTRIARDAAEQQSGREEAIARELLQTKKREWEKREREMKLQLERLERSSRRSTDELSKLQAWRSSIRRLLDDGASSVGANVDDDALVNKFRERLARQEEAEAALRIAQAEMARNEDKLTAHTKLVLENEFLRAQVDKTKQLMERVRAMRRSSTSPGARSSTPGSATRPSPRGLGVSSNANTPGKSPKLADISGKENNQPAAAPSSKPKPATATAAPRAKRKLDALSSLGGSPPWALPSAATRDAPVSKRPATCVASSAATKPANSSSSERSDAAKARARRVDFASRYINVGLRR